MIIEINFGKGFGYEKTKQAKVIRFGFFYVVLLKDRLSTILAIKEIEGRNHASRTLRDSLPKILHHLPDESIESFTALLEMGISMTGGEGFQYPQTKAK